MLKKTVESFSDCWHFLGSKDHAGYGRINGIRVHRLAYEMWVGPVGDAQVLHRCDNPPCFNPAHLFKGTVADNMRDKMNKGRLGFGISVGEKNGQSRLTAKSVRQMGSEFKPYVCTTRMLARKYGVGLGTAIKAIYGYTWGHVQAAGKDGR